MENTLSTPAPPDIQQPLQVKPANPMGPAPMNAGQGGSPLQTGQDARPALTHAQAVASIRHFSEINEKIKPIVENPQLGKTDLKSSIIDAVTKLVSERVVTPAAAVAQLSAVPNKPSEQRKWAMNLFQQNEMASAVILEQHRRSGMNNPEDAYNPDGHLQTMNDVMAHYKVK